MRIRPIAKICQTVPKYFNMDKYDYIRHIISMFVVQKMDITGISHGEKSSRFGWGTMKALSDDTRKTPENALSPSGRFPVSRRCCQKNLKSYKVMSLPYVLYGEIRHTNYMAMGGQLNLIWVSSCSLYGEGTSHFIMYLVWWRHHLVTF